MVQSEQLLHPKYLCVGLSFFSFACTRVNAYISDNDNLPSNPFHSTHAFTHTFADTLFHSSITQAQRESREAAAAQRDIDWHREQARLQKEAEVEQEARQQNPQFDQGTALREASKITRNHYYCQYHRESALANTVDGVLPEHHNHSVLSRSRCTCTRLFFLLTNMICKLNVDGVIIFQRPKNGLSSMKSGNK